MALLSKISLSVSADWNTITITDSTGFGITGYGTNQDPVGYRECTSSGNDILTTQIILTSPSGSTYTFNLTASQAYNAAINGYQITNVDLGYAADSTIEEGIWQITYTTFFANAGSVTLNLSSASTSVVYTGNDLNFINVGYLKLDASGTPVYIKITNVSTSTNTLTLESAPGITNSSYTNYHVGYTGSASIPIAKTIKDCMDAKVAALPDSNCPCKEKQVNTLMNYYVLYDAMFINASNANSTKAQYIYDILDNYCADSDCKCNG